MKKYEHLGRVLSRNEQKSLTGGVLPPPSGTCRHHYNSGGYNFYSDCESKSSAQSGAASAQQVYGNGMWCCDSCVAAGYPPCES